MYDNFYSKQHYDKMLRLSLAVALSLKKINDDNNTNNHNNISSSGCNAYIVKGVEDATSLKFLSSIGDIPKIKESNNQLLVKKKEFIKANNAKDKNILRNKNSIYKIKSSLINNKKEEKNNNTKENKILSPIDDIDEIKESNNPIIMKKTKLIKANNAKSKNVLRNKNIPLKYLSTTKNKLEKTNNTTLKKTNANVNLPVKGKISTSNNKLKQSKNNIATINLNITPKNKNKNKINSSLLSNNSKEGSTKYKEYNKKINEIIKEPNNKVNEIVKTRKEANKASRNQEDMENKKEKSKINNSPKLKQLTSIDIPEIILSNKKLIKKTEFVWANVVKSNNINKNKNNKVIKNEYIPRNQMIEAKYYDIYQKKNLSKKLTNFSPRNAI